MTKEHCLKAYEHYKEVSTDTVKHKMLPSLRKNSIRAAANMKAYIEKKWPEYFTPKVEEKPKSKGKK